MKIAIIAHGLSNGGAERVASLVANHYAASGHDVLFVAAYSAAREYRLEDSVSYVYVGGNYRNKLTRLLGRSCSIHQEVKKFRADVAVSFLINETLLSTLAGSVPYIYTLRNDPGNTCSSPAMRLTSNLAFRKAQKVIFQTPNARDFFCQTIREKGVVIPNPLTRNLPVWDGTHSEKKIITACRLTRQKNLPMLISAFAQFREQYPEYTLWIYGHGDLLEELRAFAKSCGVEDAVFFPGYATNIHEIMVRSDIFALTSDFEGLSNSMLEALAIGIPTVCTDCPPGGAALYIENEVSGMLVPVGDTAQLVKCFCRMAADEEFCRNLSENSQKIRRTLDVDAVLKQWSGILD